jgi:hypothetical protein
MPDGSLQPALDGNYSLKRGDKSINVTVGWRRARYRPGHRLPHHAVCRRLERK